MDPLDRARAGQNALERIANLVPGFKGYRERELRRDADRAQREHLAERLRDHKHVLDELSRQAGRSATLDALDRIETARKRLDHVSARLLYADRGYSGFFDAIKIDEDVLARVYALDAGLVEAVAATGQALSVAERGVNGETESRPNALDAFLDALQLIEERIAQREEILRGLR